MNIIVFLKNAVTWIIWNLLCPITANILIVNFGKHMDSVLLNGMKYFPALLMKQMNWNFS